MKEDIIDKNKLLTLIGQSIKEDIVCKRRTDSEVEIFFPYRGHSGNVLSVFVIAKPDGWFCITDKGSAVSEYWNAGCRGMNLKLLERIGDVLNVIVVFRETKVTATGEFFVNSSWEDVGESIQAVLQAQMMFHGYILLTRTW